MSDIKVSGFSYYRKTPGIRRTVKVYGPKAKERMAELRQQGTPPIRRPHAGLETSVKPKIKGDIFDA